MYGCELVKVGQATLITSALSATVTIVITTLLGVPLGYMLARRTFRARQVLILPRSLSLVFPPVRSGLLLLILSGPYGLVGTPFASVGSRAGSQNW